MVKPMLPPIVRIDKDRAAVVARRASGTTIKATVALGTRTPPTPKLARVPKATAVFALSGFDTARAPPNAAGHNVSFVSTRMHLTYSSSSLRLQEHILPQSW